jgi:hypothetical protein
MPKPLFYLGVIFSALAAVLAVSVAPSQLTAAEPPAFATLSPVRPVLVLLVIVPIAALFLRMASLIAARNLFAAHFSIFAVGCTSLAVALLSTVQFRLLLLFKRPGESLPIAVSSVTELQLIILYAVGFFLSVSFLSTRPYFRLQGRFLASLVLVPVPLYLAMLTEQYLSAPATESILGSSSNLTFLYLIIVGALFASLSFHCLRHRHLFVEVTNLRELLDSRIDPAIAVRRRSGFRLESDVAFDS